MRTVKYLTIGPCFIFLCLLFSVPANAQFSRQNQDSIRKLTQQDYNDMLKILGITSLRQGPSGTPGASNAANSDESKATHYTSLPDPLILNNGKPVTKSRTWWKKRRPEIKEYFDREIYGRVPAKVPKVGWVITGISTDSVGPYHVTVKKLTGYVDNSTYPAISVNIDLTLAIPRSAKGPVPVIMEFGFSFPQGTRPASARNTQQAGQTGPPMSAGPSWQQQVLEAGWGYAIIVPVSIQADNGAGLRSGIIGLVNKGQPRKPDDWGALRAWAWGASRALDYFETDESVDAKKIGIEGLSRYGKAAAVAMAYDRRFAIALIGSSGAGGVKLYRRVFGEQVENLASSGEYHWFAGNFIKYAGPLTPNDLPVDAHELVAMCAPRPVFISAGSTTVEGAWIDAKGMFLGGALASPVYELLGKKGFGTTEFPPMETALTSGEIAFRQHSGGHTVGPNWPYFITWAKPYLKEREPQLLPGNKMPRGYKPPERH
ncbi:MAG: acetylxylan esterase [Bacteroidota bacterium]|nr:acetylxylan esterase [Bacteroidota bacterium]